MKNRTDKILLAVFLLSLAFYIFLLPHYLEGIPSGWPDWLFTVCAWLAVGFHAVPAFCLQLFLCRRVRRWVAVIPAVLIIGAALWFAYGYFSSTGWDTLGWGIMMILSIAPAAGCVLAWAAYGLWRLYQRGDIHAG